MRKLLAIYVGKILSSLAKLIGYQGVTLAGKIALQIDPNILSKLSKDIREKVIVVCGTNGKTTTNNLLAKGIEDAGYKVICNKTGSNMLNGIVSSFVLSANWKGHIDYDYACLEVDEASAKLVFPHIHPDLMVITNLFRDQLDRYGEIDITMKELLKAISLSDEKLELLVNGDDSLSYYIAKTSGKNHQCFGILEEVENQKTKGEIREGYFCPSCGEKLDYSLIQFSQIGTYHCHHCDFTHPHLSYQATNIQVGEGLAFKIEDKAYDCHFRGFYNMYNILAVYGAMSCLGIDKHNFKKTLDEYHPENGRNEVFYIQGRKVILNLAKNPAGFNQNIYSVMADKEDKDLLIAINDLDQDGRDISWLWDVDFQLLNHPSITSIGVSGLRKEDLQLRFKYEDIQTKIYNSIKEGVEEKLKVNKDKTLYVLVNYTCLYKTHHLLKEMEKSSS